MKHFFKGAVLLLAVLICVLATACTDGNRDDKNDTGVTGGSVSETVKDGVGEQTSENWGLGPVMPE